MQTGDRSELKRAFIETGALVFGGLAGGGGAYLLFGDRWMLQAASAIAGAWLVRYLASSFRANSTSSKQ
jgi:hypothetical protein